MSNTNIRPFHPNDLPAVKAVIDATGLFPSELLDAMVPNGTANDEEAGDDPSFWLTWDEDGPAGVAYCAPEPMTSGTWNLLLIAVHPERHGRGVGTRLTTHVEERLAARGERVLLVETSGTDDFERTRGFYRHLGYEEEARIRDYYDAGDDKIVFRKAL